MTATEQQATMLLGESLAVLRAETSAAFCDLQVILLRELAAWLRTGAASPEGTLPLESRADQLEAASREIRNILRRCRPPTDYPRPSDSRKQATR